MPRVNGDRGRALHGPASRQHNRTSPQPFPSVPAMPPATFPAVKWGKSLAARLTTLLSGESSPFVTQAQLADLMKTDRSNIERQFRQAEWMIHHPQRGMSATPYLLMQDWRRFLCWIDGAIQHLEQPRPVPELEHLIRTWQDRRGNIIAPNLRWRRRADVIAV